MQLNYKEIAEALKESKQDFLSNQKLCDCESQDKMLNIVLDNLVDKMRNQDGFDVGKFIQVYKS